jgi:hypothetical protein
MNYSEWLKHRSCGHCGSSKLEIVDMASPAANVCCGECHAFLCTWRDFKKSSAAQPVKSDALPRPKRRSQVLKVWCATRPTTNKR